MDCKYIQQNEIHENYLLNRLPAAEKTEYEKHIEGCFSCREELNKERETIEGIRRVGLQEMKNEIRRQVADVKTQKKTLDWQMILKFAAVMFIIAIIPSAIYYFQTEQGKPISQLVKPEDSKPESEYFVYDETQVEDKSETSKETIEPSPKSTIPSEKPVIKERDALQNITEEDKLAISSGTASGGAGRGYASAKTKDIKAMIDSDSIVDEESAEQPQSIIVSKGVKDELLQKLSEGLTYHFVGSDEKEKAPRFKTQEMTTAQQYDAVASKKLAPETSLMGKSIGSADSKLTITSNAIYESEEKRISINFLSVNRDLMTDEKSKLPQSFEVQILNRDSLNWIMNWYVNKEFLEYDPQQIKIVVNKSKLYSIILDVYIYEIDITTDSTKAILTR